jgi:isocitrate/isopropylmalate dehydrogenase
MSMVLLMEHLGHETHAARIREAVMQDVKIRGSLSASRHTSDIGDAIRAHL